MRRHTKRSCCNSCGCIVTGVPQYLRVLLVLLNESVPHSSFLALSIHGAYELGRHLLPQDKGSHDSDRTRDLDGTTDLRCVLHALVRPVRSGLRVVVPVLFELVYE